MVVSKPATKIINMIRKGILNFVSAKLRKAKVKNVRNVIAKQVKPILKKVLDEVTVDIKKGFGKSKQNGKN